MYEKTVSSVQQWATKRALYISGKKPTNFIESHRDMSGGNYFIPPELNDEFLHQYANSLKIGDELYIAERITNPVFRYYIDLDFLSENEPISEEVKLNYCKTILGVVNDFYKTIYNDVSDRRVILSTTKPRSKDSGGIIYIKDAIHMNWPNILATSEDAVYIRSAIIECLTNRYGERPWFSTWSLVVDTSIYFHNGLRLIGSKKEEKCPYCKGKNSENYCNTCHGKKILKHQGQYAFWHVLDGECRPMPDEYDKLHDDLEYLIRQTSIRSFEKCTGHDAIMNYKPRWFSGKLLDDGKQPKRKRAGSEIDPPGLEDKVGLERLKIRIRVPTNSDKFIEFSKFVDSFLPKQFKGSIIELNVCDNKEYYVARTKCHFCLNKGGNHNKNTIYFYITKSHCYQKCFCMCDEVRKFGKCSEYTSTGYKLTPKLQKLLFDNIVSRNTLSFAPEGNYVSLGPIIPVMKTNSRPFQLVQQKMLVEKKIAYIDHYLDALYDIASGKSEYEQQFQKKKQRKT